MDNKQEYFNKGLVEAYEKSLLDGYFEGRDKPAPYIAPFPEPANTDMVSRLAIPVVKITATAGAVGIILKTAISGALAVTAFIAENSLLIGAGIFSFVSLLLFASGVKCTFSQTKNTAHDGKKWEFYQKQEQGWREV